MAGQIDVPMRALVGDSGWTPERRAKQAEAIRRWKPWARSTGPKSGEGKAAASRNAWKGGKRAEWRELMKGLNRLLREQRTMLEK